MRAGVIEIGTNSIKFCLAEKKMDRIQILLDEDIVTRLGERQSETGKMSDVAMQRTVIAIKDCLNTAHKFKVDRIVGVGTMALRVASNAQEFLQQVYSECGLSIKIISREKEAELSYKGAVSSLPIKNINCLVVDIGGGSTEFIWGTANKIESIVSLNLGVVYLTEKFLISNPPTDSELHNASQEIKNLLIKNRIMRKKSDQLIGVGGTITTMIAIKYGMTEYIPEKIRAAKLDIKDVKAQIGIFKSKTVEERKKIAGLPPERADVILAGALIVYAVLQNLQFDSLIGSDRGLRHAVLFDILNENFSNKNHRGKEQ